MDFRAKVNLVENFEKREKQGHVFQKRITIGYAILWEAFVWNK